MSHSLESQTLAFAGICQAASLVQQVARQGVIEDKEVLATTLNSIMVTDAAQSADIYGGHDHLRLGYQTLIEQLSPDSSKKNAELTRYLVGLVALERKLSKRRDLLSMLGERISQVKRQLHHFELLDEQVLGNLAGIYSDIISPLGPRIQVAGNPSFLQQPLVQHQIRALLLAGIRSAVLWRQLGGKRRHILFSRKRLVAQAQAALRY
ncbi:MULTISPECIES: high frequency lysogenization protein HflD [Oceanimonas]|uniref:High frequency lysogenization protein HflD homolog n=1 Tax=Oceanimonas doudoroffii TaxID=84158 RepID=A0A233REM9_9GAMM|nr:high frequency lysogenization protein HflD [Oceanimonas doudoroffii]NHI01363.1 High frequency lysogenization protein HflD [Oceanimonas sp. MB9]OXY81851.1 lysogenization regulator HflD [Oceanimonas doudoroffii]